MGKAGVAVPDMTTFCRVCFNFCPIVAAVENGRVVRIVGDKENVLWRGHTCAKGRVQHERLNSEERLLHSQKRMSDGSYEPIAVEDAMDEIALRLAAIIERDGMKAVAYYYGTAMMSHVTTGVVAAAFWRALGGAQVFTPSTIDKPGKPIAKALHGHWMAPEQGYDRPDVGLLLGANPLVSYHGAPNGNPGWLKQRVDDGMKLIVVDPRRTETARLATHHLQPRPGFDAALLAAFVHVILAEGLGDPRFVAENVMGLEALRAAVEPFDPGVVACAAGVGEEELLDAARVYGRAKRAYQFSGTGPSMSDPGPLIEYLVLNLAALCGHWLRDGEAVWNVPVLMRVPTYRAQAAPPVPARDPDRPMHVRGLVATVAGLPTAALAERILAGGEHRISALFSCGGNPVGAWPDAPRVIDALKSLDLVVQIDPMMSATSRIADYVIAPKMPLETPDTSQWQDFLISYHTGFGNVTPHAQYAPAVVDPPPGSDVIAEWEFFYGLARRLGIQLQITENVHRNNYLDEPLALDMERPPSEDELLEVLAKGSRIPLEEIKRHSHGRAYPADPPVHVLPKESAWPHRLDVGNPEMMDALQRVAENVARGEAGEPGRLHLICRRSRGLNNTFVNDGKATRGRRHNPAYLHPDDLQRLGLEDGDGVRLRSDYGVVSARVAGDDTLLPGLISMSHGFGAIEPDGSPVEDTLAVGTNVNRLIPAGVRFDVFSGMPQMSNIPVTVERTHNTS